MKPCFAGLGILALAATPLAAIPLALPAQPVQARTEQAPLLSAQTVDAPAAINSARNSFQPGR